MSQDHICILFVDDESDFRMSAEVDLRESLKDHGVSCDVTALDNVDEGIEALSSGDFHLAIVDLNFSHSTRSGNEVVEAVLATKILPIIVLSGYRHELRDEYTGHGLIYTPNSKSIADVVERIVVWNERDVFTFFSESGFLGSALRDILQKTMWDHLSKYWQYIDEENPATLQSIAGRIASTLLHDVLASTSTSAVETGEVPIHHGEVYIFHTPRKHLAPGDILDLDGDRFAVLSPSCDLVPRCGKGPKASEVLLARCLDLPVFVSQQPAIMKQIETIRDVSKSDRKKTAAVDNLARLMHQNWENPTGQFFFLPPFAHFTGAVIDFLRLRVEPYGNEGYETLVSKRDLSLNREMAVELVSRFARYMIRLGQPAYSTNALIDALLKGCQNLDHPLHGLSTG